MMKIKSQRVIAAIMIYTLVMTGMLAIPSPVQAASIIIVTTTTDELDSVSNGRCSLREAVVAANENRAVGGCPAGGTGTDTIIVPSNSSPYQVSGTKGENAARSGDLDILDSVVIMGAGPSQTIVAGLKTDRIFHIINLNTKLVRIQNMRITGGDGELHGGAIYSQGSRLELERVTLSGNHATTTGGGVSSTISNYGPYLIIKNSTVTLNTSESGGGVYSEGNLQIEASLIVDNTAYDVGGGIDNNAQPGYSGVMVNSTVSNNIALAGAGIVVPGPMEIFSSTIFDNSGVGILVQQFGELTLKNTIIASHAPSANCQSESTSPSALVSGGNNLADDTAANSCNLTVSDPLYDVLADPRLLGLADNGGPTKTFALPDPDSDPPSPAVDAGSSTDCPFSDQRGYGRPGGERCDIGAFEFAGTIFLHYLPVVFR